MQREPANETIWVIMTVFLRPNDPDWIPHNGVPTAMPIKNIDAEEEIFKFINFKGVCIIKVWKH